MTEPAQKCKSNDIFNQKYCEKLLIDLILFQLKVKSRFRPKQFYNINYRKVVETGFSILEYHQRKLSP